ncbi:MAG: hypothetical protein LBH00_09630 [Planctomycetaceae bacterium]|nr:hypothetical protein [Planctomycetaceae bacterium]
MKPALRKTAAEVRKKRLETGPDTRSTAADRERTAVLETQRTGLFRLLDLCREHGIFVVAVVTPKWYGQSDYTQSSLREKTDDPYIRVLQEIDKRPDCAVILSRDFEEITSEGSDEDYLFDYGHMTEEGAKVYTNWLMDRLMEMPKTAEAIRNRTTEIR